VDISIDEGITENHNRESICSETLVKGKEKERSKEDSEETVYKHFLRRVIFEDELRERLSETGSSSSEEIGSRENISDSDD